MIVTLLGLQFFFLVPLTVAFLLWNIAYYCITNNRLNEALLTSAITRPFVFVAKGGYAFSRIGFYIVGVGKQTDKAMYGLILGNEIVSTATHSIKSASDFFSLAVSKDTKSKSAVLSLQARKNELAHLLPLLDLQIKEFYTKYPFKSVKDILPITHAASVGALHLDKLLGGSRPHQYLLLFLNDKEIRPGGGFIGSFGVVTFKNYLLTDLKIEDIYEVDGQLKAHVDPHPAVRTYLQNPHGFLRDSNFSPDFYDNAQKALGFMGLIYSHQEEYDGVIGITTDVMANMIESIGKVEVPEYKETITKHNFYAKTQSYAQDNFFPGSMQKKNFLSSLAQSLLLRIPEADKHKLLGALGHSLATKELVFYAAHSQLQTLFESNNWAGRQKRPVSDYLMSVEANVGANKTNAYVKKSEDLTMALGDDNTVQHTHKTTFVYKAPRNAKSDEIYKNFYQLYLPSGAVINEVEINGIATTSYQVLPESYYSVVSIYEEIRPNTSLDIKISYTTLLQKRIENTYLYELGIQKQIGVDASPLALTIQLPPNSSLISQNFNAVVSKKNLSKKIIIDSDKELRITYLLTK